MVACVVLEQLRGFPLSKLQSAGILCSLAVVAALTFRPYLLARFGGPSANLRHAVLILADLWDADLRGADLTGADLRGAGLGGANLLRADLRRAKLSSALYDRCTRWPEGFDPQSHGAHLAGWIDCIPTDD
jgi:uncharacterized protein YjbI with pentapeptide repeats